MSTVERWATRSDAWTPEDDARLAELVLHHIRTGSTQLRAFEEAGNELGRTAAACGYRWNGVVRKHYKEQIEQAKRDRKARQKAAAGERGQSVQAVTMTSSETMKDVIKFLQTFDEQYQKLRQQVETLERERSELQDKLRQLEAQLARTPAQPVAITPEQLEEDSRTLFAIMERARKLLDAEGTRSKE
ncbi:MAG: RsfA family transcriptional regulator [Thermoflavifilum sp.]|nr:RsfA family transcriptional regulator [Thermoflavifilum sp.]MCL6514180.1 RsfA family transcriptional regulator [Alicyclobacillus sp.]